MKRLAALTLACAFAAPISAETMMTINGQDISQADFDNFIELIIEQGATDSPELRERVKEELIVRTVAVQEAERQGLDKNPEVQQELDLARQGILVRALLEDYIEAHPISDEQVEAEYNKLKEQGEQQKEYKVRHILVEAEDEAKKLLADIKDGKLSFDDAAKEHSIDPGSKENGGELGWAPSSNYVAPFAEAVETLEVGNLGDAPVESQFGWHIIELQDERAPEFPALDDVKSQITELLRQEQLSEIQDELLAKAKVEEKSSLDLLARRSRLMICPPYSRASSCANRAASSRISTPSFWAWVSLLPARSPATRKSVWLDTDPVTRAPSASSLSFAWLRVNSVKAPVSTTVLPAKILSVAMASLRPSGAWGCTPWWRNCAMISRLCVSAKKWAIDAATVGPTSGTVSKASWSASSTASKS